MHKKYVWISSSLEKETKASKGREFRPLVPTVFARGRQGTVQLKQCAFGEGETDFTEKMATVESIVEDKSDAREPEKPVDREKVN